MFRIKFLSKFTVGARDPQHKSSVKITKKNLIGLWRKA